ncbi:hypothetical protein [Micromonospora sp. U21]|nr:hypothetical protein [Micromonospora sp. U21]
MTDRFDEVGIAVSVARRGWVPAFWVGGFAALSFTRLQERPIE